MVSPFLKESLVLIVYLKQERDQGLASNGLLVNVAVQHVQHGHEYTPGLIA